MTLRKTIIGANKDGDIFKIKIYTADHVDIKSNGLWNIDTNDVMLSQEMYDHFLSLKTNEKMHQFFLDLKQISFTQILL